MGLGFRNTPRSLNGNKIGNTLAKLIQAELAKKKQLEPGGALSPL